jgi:hypothetical protein
VKDLQLGLAHHRLTAILKAFRLFFVLLDCPTTLSEFNTTSTPTTNSSPASMRVAARQDDGFSRVVDTQLNDRLEASRTSALSCGFNQKFRPHHTAWAVRSRHCVPFRRSPHLTSSHLT